MIKSFQKCSLKQLVDLALCVPEPGAVNFNILHRVLYSILHVLGIQDTEAWTDFDDIDGENVFAKSNLQEQTPSVAQKISVHDLSSSMEIEASPQMARSFDQLQTFTDNSKNMAELGRVKPPKKLTATQKSFTPQVIEQRISRSAPPTNEEILEELQKSQPTSDILTDMWRGINLNRRVAGIEEGIEKLSSLMSTHMSQCTCGKINANFQDMRSKVRDQIAAMEKLSDRYATLENAVTILDNRCLMIEKMMEKVPTEQPIRYISVAQTQTENYEEFTQDEVIVEEEDDSPIVKDHEIHLEKIYIERKSSMRKSKHGMLKDEIAHMIHMEISDLEQRLEKESLKHRIDTLEAEIRKYMEETVVDDSNNLYEMCEALKQRLEEHNEHIQEHKNELRGRLKALNNNFTALVNKRVEEIQEDSARIYSEVKKNFKKVSKEAEEVKNLLGETTREMKRVNKRNQELQRDVINLDLSKANKEDLYTFREYQKEDHKLLNNKLDKHEFRKAHQQLAQELLELQENFIANCDAHRAFMKEMMSEAKDKKMLSQMLKGLNAQCSTLQAEINKLKRARQMLRNRTVEAAGVTKCLSCGRPAVLSGMTCLAGDGPPQLAPCCNNQLVRVSADDKRIPPDHEDSIQLSAISLPETSIRKSSTYFVPQSLYERADTVTVNLSEKRQYKQPTKTKKRIKVPTFKKYDLLGFDGTVYKQCTVDMSSDELLSTESSTVTEDSLSKDRKR